MEIAVTVRDHYGNEWRLTPGGQLEVVAPGAGGVVVWDQPGSPAQSVATDDHGFVWLMAGDHGLTGLMAGRPQEIATGRALLAVAIGFSVLIVALSARTQLARDGAALLARARKLAGALDRWGHRGPANGSGSGEIAADL